MIKFIWAALALSMIGGIYFTNPPKANESALIYVMSNSGETWQSFSFVIVSAMCGSILIMYYAMRKQ